MWCHLPVNDNGDNLGETDGNMQSPHLSKYTPEISLPNPIDDLFLILKEIPDCEAVTFDPESFAHVDVFVYRNPTIRRTNCDRLESQRPPTLGLTELCGRAIGLELVVVCFRIKKSWNDEYSSIFEDSKSCMLI